MKIDIDTDALKAKFNEKSSSGFLLILKDFVTFKTMIFSALVIAFYIVSTVICMGYGIFQIFSKYGSTFWGICLFFIGPFVLHLFFEFLMIPFALLDTLREVRNETRAVKEELSQFE